MKEKLEMIVALGNKLNEVTEEKMETYAISKYDTLIKTINIELDKIVTGTEMVVEYPLRKWEYQEMTREIFISFNTCREKKFKVIFGKENQEGNWLEGEMQPSLRNIKLFIAKLPAALDLILEELNKKINENKEVIASIDAVVDALK